jgi:hypothetical protein
MFNDSSLRWTRSFEFKPPPRAGEHSKDAAKRRGGVMFTVPASIFGRRSPSSRAGLVAIRSGGADLTFAGRPAC